MTNDRETRNEFDILAYVDGRLDCLPRRKAEVEAALARSPEMAARVEAYQAQNEALHAAYNGRLTDPVPSRLSEVLETPAARRDRMRPAMAAASLALALLAGVGGWAIARWQSPEIWNAQALLEESYRDFVSAQAHGREGVTLPRQTIAGLGADSSFGALNRLSEEVSLTLRVPDLSKRGYRIVSKETLAQSGSESVRITYAGAEGEAFHLYLRPRWDERDAALQVARRGQVSLGYWLDGPLAAAIASRMSPERTKELAEAVREEMTTSRAQAPAIRLPRSVGQEASLDDDVLQLDTGNEASANGKKP